MALGGKFPIADHEWTIGELHDMVGVNVRIDTGYDVVENAGTLVAVELDPEGPGLIATLELNTDEIWPLFSSDRSWTLLGESLIQGEGYYGDDPMVPE